MKFTEGQEVFITINGNKEINGEHGFIVGCATQEQAVIGRIWLVQIGGYGRLWSKDYPFSVIAIPENQLEVVD